MAKKPPVNVQKLIAQQQRKHPKASDATLAKRFVARGPKPKPRGEPTAVLWLLAFAKARIKARKDGWQ